MNKKETLEKAREKFGKQSRSKRHEQKILLALYWTNAFHFSTPSVIDCLVQNKKRGFAKKLTEKQLLIEKDIYSYLPYFPKKILTLSKQGRELLSFMNPNIIIWEGKVAEGHVFHDYLVQIYTLHLLKSLYGNFLPNAAIVKEPKETAIKKQYDALITPYPQKTSIGIEVDLTRKKIREIHNALFNIYLDLQNNLIHEVHFVFPKQHYELFKNQYEQVLNQKIFLYEKDQYNRYRKTFKSVQYSPEDKEKIHFEAIDIPPQICPKPQEEIEDIIIDF